MAHEANASPLKYEPITTLAERLAEEMRTLLPGHHLHLHALARRLCVRSIEWDEALEADGCTIWEADGPHIRLRPDVTMARRRFTLAHELTHVFLGHGQLAETNMRRAGRTREERVCDATAGALLMPRESIDKLVHGHVTLGDIKETSEFLDVSLSALVVRLNQLSARRYLLLNAILRKNGELLLKPTIGLPWDTAAQAVLSPESYRSLGRLERTTTDLQILLRAGDKVFACSGQGNRRGLHLLAFVEARETYDNLSRSWGDNKDPSFSGRFEDFIEPQSGVIG